MKKDLEANISFSPVIDAKGRIFGTAAITTGFGNDNAGPGVLKGSLKGDELSFTMASGTQKLSFKGVRSSGGFSGTLKYNLPPEKGVRVNFPIPDVFAPPPSPPVSLAFTLSDEVGDPVGTLLVSTEAVSCALELSSQLFFGRTEQGADQVHPDQEGFWLHLDLFDTELVSVGGIAFFVDSLSSPVSGSWRAANSRGEELFSGFWSE